jgi:hypothetical protein
LSGFYEPLDALNNPLDKCLKCHYSCKECTLNDTASNCIDCDPINYRKSLSASKCECLDGWIKW